MEWTFRRLKIGDWQLKNKGRIRMCMVGNFVSGRSQFVVCKALQKLIVKSE